MFDKAKNLYKFQKQARQINKELKNTHIEAEQEGVIILIDGKQNVVKVTINDEAMQDKKKLENSLEKAFNKGVTKSQQIGAELMKDVMGDMNFPGMG
jgi:DNA-binding protein YbaB